MQAAVYADTGDAREAPIGEICTLQQYSANLGAVMENIIRPFDRNAPIVAKDFAQRVSCRDAGDKAEFRGPVWRRRIDQKQARMQIAPRRRPDAAIAAAPLGLGIGDHPQSAGIALFGARQTLVVGRGELVIPDQTERIILGRSGETIQGKTPIGCKFKTATSPPPWWRR